MDAPISDEIFFLVLALCVSELLPFLSFRANGFLHAVQIKLDSLAKVCFYYAEEQATSSRHVQPKEKQGPIVRGSSNQTNRDEQGQDQTAPLG
jgi:hypothetical protein